VTKRLFIVVFLLTSTAFAKTHEDELQVPCDKVWAAVRQVLMHSGKYGVLFLSNEDLTASFNIGGGLGGKRTNSVQLRPNGAGCTMSTQTAFSGLAHNDAGDFLKRVKDALEQLPAAKEPEAKPAESAKPKPAAEPAPQPTAQPAAPAAAEPENLATVNVKSTPDGADITVDGKFAGNAPSTLRLPAGDHTILIEKSGMKPWQRTMTVSPGGNVTIDAKLEQAQ
jgi:hypothetical protein